MADETRTDIDLSDDSLLVTTLNDNDRVTITREATGQQVATMKVADLKKWTLETVPYIGENMAVYSDRGSVPDVIYDIKDDDIGKTLTFTIQTLYTGNAFTLILFNVIDAGFVWGALNVGVEIVPDANYKTYSLTFTVPEGIRNQDRAIRVSGNANLSAVKWYKLEPGILGTPWSPVPSEIARLLDYCSLYEQTVPGEFWIDEDGNKRQVYMRTFTGVTGALNGTTIVTTLVSGGIRAAFIVTGSVTSGGSAILPPVTAVNTYNGALRFTIYNQPDDYWAGKKYSITVKYTKQ